MWKTGPLASPCLPEYPCPHPQRKVSAVLKVAAKLQYNKVPNVSRDRVFSKTLREVIKLALDHTAGRTPSTKSLLLTLSTFIPPSLSIFQLGPLFRLLFLPIVLQMLCAVTLASILRDVLCCRRRSLSGSLCHSLTLSPPRPRPGSLPFFLVRLFGGDETIFGLYTFALLL